MDNNVFEKQIDRKDDDGEELGAVCHLGVFLIGGEHCTFEYVLAKCIPYADYGYNPESYRAAFSSLEVIQAPSTLAGRTDWAKITMCFE